MLLKMERFLGMHSYEATITVETSPQKKKNKKINLSSMLSTWAGPHLQSCLYTDFHWRYNTLQLRPGTRGLHLTDLIHLGRSVGLLNELGLQPNVPQPNAVNAVNPLIG